jgi:hypothetical protein
VSEEFWTFIKAIVAMIAFTVVVSIGVIKYRDWADKRGKEKVKH